MSRSRFWPLGTLAAGSLTLLACGGSPAPGEVDAGDEPPPLVLEGGSIAPDGCGYSVSVRANATAPEPGRELLGAAPAPKRIHLGLAGDPATSMAVQWQTDEETLATRIEYGKASVGEASAGGFTFLYNAGFGSEGPFVRVHEAHLCGLEPDTEYRYRVGGVGADGAAAWSSEARFRTAPDLAADPSAEVTVLVLGDTRNGYDIFGGLLADALERASPDLVLFTGDAVTIGPLQHEWDLFYDAAEPALRQVPMISAHGNHEANSIHYFALAVQPGDEENYTLDYGPFHLVVVNDTPPEDGEVESRITGFLDGSLQAATAKAPPWLLVMHHRPLYSSAANHGSDLALRALWEPLYDAHGVDLVLNGHDHNYERTLPMRASVPQASPADGTVYVVAGGAGAVLYGAGTSEFTAASKSTQHYVLLRIRAGRLELTAYDDAGTELDRLEILDQ